MPACRIEGHRSLARQRQRPDCLAGKPLDRFRIDCDDVRLGRQGVGGNLYRQHRRQTLRQLHELNCCGSGRTGRFCFGNTITSRITDKRLDRGRAVVRREPQRHRRPRIQSKRKRTTRGNNEARSAWGAKRHERSQTSGIESFNGQRKKRFVFCRDEDRTSTVKFGKAATDANVTFTAK